MVVLSIYSELLIALIVFFFTFTYRFKKVYLFVFFFSNLLNTKQRYNQSFIICHEPREFINKFVAHQLETLLKDIDVNILIL